LKVNRIDRTDLAGAGISPGKTTTSHAFGKDYIIAAAMIVYSVITFANPATASLPAMLMATTSYLLAIYLFFGIAWLAFRRRTLLLWSAAGVAVLLGFMFTGSANAWQLVTNWSLLLFAGVITGRLNIGASSQVRIYILGMAAVVVFGLLQMYPIWSDLISLASENSQLMVNDVRDNLIAMGYSADAVSDEVAFLQRMMDLVIHMIPASMILGILVQYSIGFLFFLYHLDRQQLFEKRLMPYTQWKMPFAITPVLMLAILARVLGGNQLQMIADNCLAVLSVYYSLTGLSVCEHYLRKLQLTRLMKFLFYVVLFFTQVIGYFVMVLVGFIDSFADWRKEPVQTTA
jgi:uncharacterized protein YybS (DUF2232 family)